ncbi:MAG: TetR/AcrR family transcriptional regulator [Vulcanimicrobiaceae bacterium]
MPNVVVMARPYHHGNLRASLLATSLALVDEVGLDGFSLREVSRRAGVSHAAAYNHFSDKAAVVEALVTAAFVRLRDALERAERRPATPIERLENIGVAYIRFACANPTEFRFMFRPELSAPSATSDPPEAGTGAYAILQRTVEAAIAAGDIVDLDAPSVALASWSLVHGFATLAIDGPDRRLATTVKARVALARRIVSIVASGLAAKK